MEGTFTRWIRFGGWNNALFAPGIDGGQALAGECFFGGSDKILSPDSGTIEFYFKAKDGAVPAPALYQCFLGSGWQRKDQVSPAALRLAVFARDQKIGFSINNREQRRQSAMLSVSLPKDLDYRQWRHLACVLDGAADGDQVARVYLDGKRLFGSFKNEKASDAPKIGFYTAAPLTIQLGCAPGGRYESGFLMDEFRISRVARYRDNFTVDFKPWNIDDNTSALFHFDGSLEGTGPNGAKLTATPGIDGI